jgi:hypothetical protein
VFGNLDIRKHLEKKYRKLLLRSLLLYPDVLALGSYELYLGKTKKKHKMRLSGSSTQKLWKAQNECRKDSVIFTV